MYTNECLFLVVANIWKLINVTIIIIENMSVFM